MQRFKIPMGYKKVVFDQISSYCVLSFGQPIGGLREYYYPSVDQPAGRCAHVRVYFYPRSRLLNRVFSNEEPPLFPVPNHPPPHRILVLRRYRYFHTHRLNVTPGRLNCPCASPIKRV